MSRADVTLDDLYLYEIGYYKDKDGDIKKMTKKAAKKEKKEHKSALKPLIKHLKSDEKKIMKGKC